MAGAMFVLEASLTEQGPRAMKRAAIAPTPERKRLR